MTPSGILNGNSKWNREYDGRNAGVSVARPFNLRDELNRAYTACKVIIRPLEQKRGKLTLTETSLYKKTMAKLGEATDQLELLNLCDFIREFDAENLKKAIAAFEAETQAMKEGES